MPNTPHHVVQRGHSRQTVYGRERRLQLLQGEPNFFKQKFGRKIFAYCLMNHIHLIIDPGNNTEMLCELMKRVAGRQTRSVNKLEKPTGSLEEGRFKSSLGFL